MKYKVKHLTGDIFQVYSIPKEKEPLVHDGTGMSMPWELQEEILYTGWLSECEAYIRLKENDKVDF